MMGVLFMKRWVWFPLLAAAFLVLAGAAGPTVFFQMKDPAGDEHGYGNYQYPTNIAFRPFKGLFDITEFKVWSEQPGLVYFDTTFQDNTNPWMAPEGFIHQNLRIFIDSVPEQGSASLPRRGAYVQFNPKHAWDIGLRIAGWGNSQLIFSDNGKYRHTSLKTEIMGDNRTIRATVPVSVIGTPDRSWRYYVLVGSYDGFGEDFFRRVMRSPGEWAIGGGSDQPVEPQVLDILAPDAGSQNRQLTSYDPAGSRLAELQPVGPGLAAGRWGRWLLSLIGLAVLGAAAYYGWRRLRRTGNISWFWIRVRDREKQKGV
jgi:carbohydrate-binding DOMON domain-containing protein